MKFFTSFTIAICISTSLLSQETIKIPDIGLEEALIALNLDSNGLTGDILVSDTKYIVNLNINDPLNNKKLPNVNSKIKDLTGIEHFTNLTRLDCYGNEIRKINLTKNTKLTFLNCGDNKIETLDLSNNAELTSISCDYNKITSLKLGNKPVLIDLYCNNNYIEVLDIKECATLKNLDATGNRIKSIIIDKTVYDKNSDTWYKDASANYTEDVNTIPIKPAVTKKEEIVNTPVTNNNSSNNSSVVKNETSTNASAANYYEKFQLSVVAEYDKLILDPTYLKGKQQLIQDKYKLNANDLSQWITKFSNLKNASTTVNPDKNSAIFHAKFKQAAVDEYEKLVLNSSYLQSKKNEIQQKYNLTSEEFSEWISLLGNPSLKAKQELPKEDAASLLEKFKQSVVKEYENLVLNEDHFQTIKAQIQKKYNLTSTQLNEWISKNSTIKNP